MLPYFEVVASADIRSIAFELSAVRSQAIFWRVVRAGERLTAGVLLVLTFPVLALAAIILVAISRRSPLVAHQRVGQGGRLIWVLKLRTMWKDNSEKRSTFIHRLAASEAPLLPPNRKNARVTNPFAALCRRYSLDELPQLWHVVRGEMALVGPRPITPEELSLYYGRDASRVLAARPGISGLWQISGRSRLSYTQRRRLDLFLVRKWSFWLYLRILVLTVPRVLAGKDAW